MSPGRTCEHAGWERAWHRVARHDDSRVSVARTVVALIGYYRINTEYRNLSSVKTLDRPRSMPSSFTSVRILFLADSHLGFDLPLRPRIEQRRRGHDFQSNYEAALAPAKAGEVDLVVHGGDVFHRPRVPASLVFQAFRSLTEIAESGVPVFVVPGNHERSRIPHSRFAAHPDLHIFGNPDAILVETRGVRVALAGFPYHRRSVRTRFPQLLEETGWRRKDADLRLLCMHHCVEGATVGPADHTFRHAPDVIRCSDLPRDFAAVFRGTSTVTRFFRMISGGEGCPLRYSTPARWSARPSPKWRRRRDICCWSAGRMTEAAGWSAKTSCAFRPDP